MNLSTRTASPIRLQAGFPAKQDFCTGPPNGTQSPHGLAAQILAGPRPVELMHGKESIDFETTGHCAAGPGYRLALNACVVCARDICVPVSLDKDCDQPAQRVHR